MASDTAHNDSWYTSINEEYFIFTAADTAPVCQCYTTSLEVSSYADQYQQMQSKPTIRWILSKEKTHQHLRNKKAWATWFSKYKVIIRISNYVKPLWQQVSLFTI